MINFKFEKEDEGYVEIQKNIFYPLTIMTRVKVDNLVDVNMEAPEEQVVKYSPYGVSGNYYNTNIKYIFKESEIFTIDEICDKLEELEFSEMTH